MKKKTLLYALAMGSTMAMASPALAVCGTVLWFNNSKGFGFITGDNGVKIFVHHSGITGGSISENQRVCYDVANGKKGPEAINVVPE